MIYGKIDLRIFILIIFHFYSGAPVCTTSSVTKPWVRLVSFFMNGSQNYFSLSKYTGMYLFV